MFGASIVRLWFVVLTLVKKNRILDTLFIYKHVKGAFLGTGLYTEL